MSAQSDCIETTLNVRVLSKADGIPRDEKLFFEKNSIFAEIRDCNELQSQLQNKKLVFKTSKFLMKTLNCKYEDVQKQIELKSDLTLADYKDEICKLFKIDKNTPIKFNQRGKHISNKRIEEVLGTDPVFVKTLEGNTNTAELIQFDNDQAREFFNQYFDISPNNENGKFRISIKNEIPQNHQVLTETKYQFFNKQTGETFTRCFNDKMTFSDVANEFMEKFNAQKENIKFVIDENRYMSDSESIIQAKDKRITIIINDTAQFNTEINNAFATKTFQFKIPNDPLHDHSFLLEYEENSTKEDIILQIKDMFDIFDRDIFIYNYENTKDNFEIHEYIQCEFRIPGKDKSFTMKVDSTDPGSAVLNSLQRNYPSQVSTSMRFKNIDPNILFISSLGQNRVVELIEDFSLDFEDPLGGRKSLHIPLDQKPYEILPEIKKEFGLDPNKVYLFDKIRMDVAFKDQINELTPPILIKEHEINAKLDIVKEEDFKKARDAFSNSKPEKIRIAIILFGALTDINEKFAIKMSEDASNEYECSLGLLEELFNKLDKDKLIFEIPQLFIPMDEESAENIRVYARGKGYI